uniref:AlNc14C286G10175 protein n=1 Tax=Albugo laibachii Nc14 TaxID=890382 RepID=F0WV29_9STRA|nr:AlNc14C286G10175 [Albugo laibachii Nc14]|eukprot:CCA25266.1 AlNc14C286G10175 [Albugo laibachii Nc14]
MDEALQALDAKGFWMPMVELKDSKPGY